MREIYLEIATLKIKINLLEHPEEGSIKISARKRLEKELLAYLKVFITKKFKRADFTIDVDSEYKPADIMYTYDKGTYVLLFKRVSKRRIVTFYQISMYQLRLIFQRVLSILLSEHKGFSMHCSAILKGSSVDFFLGKSGAGKSTISTFLEKKYLKLTDDISYLKKDGSKFYFYEAPEIDKNWPASRLQKYPVGNFFFLKKAKFFKAEKITSEKALKLLMKKESIYDLSRESAGYLMEFAAGFDNFYMLYFAKDQDKLLEFYKNI